MLKYCILLSVLCFVSCQNWGSRSCVVNPLDYFIRLMQATVTELETEVKWCNMKLDDVSAPINVQLYNWHVVGTVNYTNGFLVSIEKIDVDNFLQSFGTRTVDGVQQTLVTFRGNLNLHNMNIGFDVDIDFNDIPPQRVTGVYTHTLIRWTYLVERNLNTNLSAIFITGSSVSGGTHRMIYMPQSSVTEAASRTFAPFLNGNSISRWGTTISSIILKKTEEIEFPEVRFTNDC